jgi:hypothetical protein
LAEQRVDALPDRDRMISVGARIVHAESMAAPGNRASAGVASRVAAGHPDDCE